MRDKEFEKEEEKIVDLKGTIESFIEEEPPELSQEEAIKAYKDGKIEYPKKRKKSATSEEEENQDDEQMKRVKQQLLESLERVKTLEKKIFEEKENNLKNIKVKPNNQKTKNREQVIEQMREKMQDEKGRSR